MEWLSQTNHFAIGKYGLPHGTELGPPRWGFVAEHKSMLVERPLRVICVEVAGAAYAIAWNYLSRTGAIGDVRADNDRLVAIIMDLFDRGEFNKIRLANLAITQFQVRPEPRGTNGNRP
jgi:hypothetical protein